MGRGTQTTAGTPAWMFPNRLATGSANGSLGEGVIHPCEYDSLWVEYEGDEAIPYESG